MLRRLFIWCICLLLYGNEKGFAQEVDYIKSFASENWPDNQDLVTTRKKAYEKAIIDGLERRYGQVFSQGNATYVRNMNNGSEVVSKSDFLSVSNRLVRGEHLRTISEIYKEEEKAVKVDGKKVVIRQVLCNIEFEAREVKNVPVKFKTYTSSCDERINECKTTSFYDGDKVYLFFKSPESGFISVYMDQEIEGKHVTNCFLPGQDKSNSDLDEGIPVKGDIDYVFFSKTINPDIKGYYPRSFDIKVDGNEKEIPKLFVLYSKSPLQKPMLSEIPVSEEFKNKYKGYELPKGILTTEFLTWLYQTRIQHPDLTYEDIVLTFQKFRD